MTTKVTIVVEEGGSWDALVTPTYGEGTPDGPAIRVKQGATQEMWISAGAGFKVEEVEFSGGIDADSTPDDAEDEEVDTETHTEGQDDGGTEAVDDFGASGGD